MLHNELRTVFGWTLHVQAGANPRSLRNYPMQANGAEVMRLACILSTEAGTEVCAPIHDALLIRAPTADIEDAAATTKRCMAAASAAVLDGFELCTDANIVKAPSRFVDGGGDMWDLV